MSVLLQFRACKVALIANIEKAFFPTGVKDTDRDTLRFLLVEDPTENLPQIMEKKIHHGVLWSISSMGHVGETINDHLEKYRNQIPEVIEKIENSLYVDQELMNLKLQ